MNMNMIQGLSLGTKGLDECMTLGVKELNVFTAQLNHIFESEFALHYVTIYLNLSLHCIM